FRRNKPFDCRLRYGVSVYVCWLVPDSGKGMKNPFMMSRVPRWFGFNGEEQEAYGCGGVSMVEVFDGGDFGGVGTPVGGGVEVVVAAAAV
nr:hypothetical protein [Tanacetum cinerariifolium]